MQADSPSLGCSLFNQLSYRFLDAAELAVTLRRTRAEHLATLQRALDPRIPLIYVPYLFARSHGARATRRVSELLAEEL